MIGVFGKAAVHAAGWQTGRESFKMLGAISEKARTFAFPVRLAEDQLTNLVEIFTNRQDLDKATQRLAQETSALLATLNLLAEQGKLPDSEAMRTRVEETSQALRSL